MANKCITCNGTGRGSLGGNCASCRGTGQVGNTVSSIQVLIVLAFAGLFIYVVVSNLVH